MKLALGLASALLVAGCAGDPYYAGYGGYGYSYDTYRPYDHGTAFSYDYGYPSYYGNPAIGGGVYFQYRDDDGRRWHRNDRDDRGRQGRWRDRDADAPRDFGGHRGGPVYSDQQPFIPPGQRPDAQGR